jgi:adenosylhomocysteine nucleosidase
MAFVAVTGLAAEASIARRAGLRTGAGGGDAARTEAAIARLLVAGATGLVSFGICGGLDPALASGTLLLASAVRDEAGAIYAVDDVWRDRLHRALGMAGMTPQAVELLGTADIVASPERKAILFRDHGAAAIDLESHLVARAARRRGLPVIVLRVVADAAVRRLPPAALLTLDEDGRPSYRAVLGSIANDPAQLPGLLRLALDTQRALAALRRAAAVLGRTVAERG